MQQKYFLYTWAQNGDIVSIPNAPDSNGFVSYDVGFGLDYQLQLGVDANAKNIQRVTWNAAFADVTINLQNYQQWGTPEFITSSDNNGIAFVYNKGALCRLVNTSNNPQAVTFVSLVDNNTDTPGQSSQKWADNNNHHRPYIVITESGNFTMPEGPIEVTVIGGGSGGNGCTPNGPSAGGCGGGGGWAVKRYTITDFVPGQPIAVVIGAGSQGAAAGGSTAAGGTTTFGPSLSATGGGSVGFAAGGINGGFGGQGAGGDINAAGEDGSDGNVNAYTSPFNWAGRSGSSFLGGGVRSSEGQTGRDGKAAGAGGGSAYVISTSPTGIGGNGANGCVIIKFL